VGIASAIGSIALAGTYVAPDPRSASTDVSIKTPSAAALEVARALAAKVPLGAGEGLGIGEGLVVAEALGAGEELGVAGASRVPATAMYGAARNAASKPAKTRAVAMAGRFNAELLGDKKVEDVAESEGRRASAGVEVPGAAGAIAGIVGDPANLQRGHVSDRCGS